MPDGQNGANTAAGNAPTSSPCARQSLPTSRTHRGALKLLDQLWVQFDVIEVDQPAVVRASVLAERLGLRRYDAVHCAAAESVRNGDLVAAAGDQELLHAWSELGLATYDTNTP